MQGRRKIFLLVTHFFCAGLLRAQEDPVLYAKDSVIELPADPTISFFQNGEKLANLSKTFVITATKKTQSVAALLGSKQMAFSDHVLSDLDNDGKKELLILNFTDGALAWEDEIWIYKYVSSNKYQYAGKLLGGFTVITEEKNFIYSFKDYFKKFFACIACYYTDTSDAAPIPLREITVSYVKGKLVLPKGDQELRSIINDNLDKLGEHATRLLVTNDDDGTRKEIALNLAVYYYSFGKNLAATKALFSKKFKDPDVNTVWKAFAQKLQLINTRVSF